MEQRFSVEMVVMAMFAAVLHFHETPLLKGKETSQNTKRQKYNNCLFSVANVLASLLLCGQSVFQRYHRSMSLL